MKPNKYILATMAIACTMAMSSCSDDEKYDVYGNPNNLVYANDCSGAFKLVQTPAGAFGSLECSIPVKCNQKASGNITVNIAPDFSLVDAYNEKNGTSYLPLPQNAFTIENGSLVIPVGETISSEQA